MMNCDAESSRKEFSEKKERLLSLLDKTQKFYESENDSQYSEAFKCLIDEIQNGEFTIVVIGEFSSGKSTLLNALMKKRILPSYTNETTATVNFLRHKEKSEHGEAGRVFYNDGRTIEIDDLNMDTIKKFSSTEGENVAKTINKVELYLDSDFLKDGVTLVDSPGLNGVAEGHKDITENQMLKSHASIFLFSSDHPGSKTDFEFLHDLQKRVKTIFFVLNKIDMIKKEEGETPESVIAKLKENYKKQFPEESVVPEIWPVSASMALDAYTKTPVDFEGRKFDSDDGYMELETKSQLPSFEDRLTRFLTKGEKTRQLLLAPIDKIISVMSDSKNSYEDNINILENETDSSKIENEIENIKKITEDLKKQISLSRNDISKKVTGTFTEISDQFEAELEKLQKQKIDEIDTLDDIDELENYINEFENSVVKRTESIAERENENLHNKILNMICISYSAQVDKLESKISNENSSIKLEVKNQIDIPEEAFLVGLEKMDEEEKRLEEESHELQKGAESARNEYYKQRDIENRKIELNKKIEQNRENIKIISEQMLPSASHYTEHTRKKENREGIFGIAGNLLFGPKDVEVEEYHTDDSERKAEETRRREQIKEEKDQIADKTADLNKLPETNTAIAEEKQMEMMQQLAEVKDSLKHMKEEHTKEIEKKNNKEIRRMKRRLNNCCDDLTSELVQQVKNGLRQLQNNYTNSIAGIVEANIKAQLDDRQKRMDELKIQMESSAKDRDDNISIMKDKINQIKTILSEAVDLQSEIENDEADMIKQEKL